MNTFGAQKLGTQAPVRPQRTPKPTTSVQFSVSKQSAETEWKVHAKAFIIFPHQQVSTKTKSVFVDSDNYILALAVTQIKKMSKHEDQL